MVSFHRFYPPFCRTKAIKSHIIRVRHLIVNFWLRLYSKTASRTAKLPSIALPQAPMARERWKNRILIVRSFRRYVRKSFCNLIPFAILLIENEAKRKRKERPKICKFAILLIENKAKRERGRNDQRFASFKRRARRKRRTASFLTCLRRY